MQKVTAFENHMKNKLKKHKDQEDQKFLDNMLLDMKKKHEQQHKERIAKARQILQELTQGR